MKKELKIYFRFLKMHLLSALEYKGWWLMCLQVLVVCLSDIVATFLLFDRFGAIGKWTVAHIALVYALAVTAFGLAETFFRGFDYFPWNMIRTGDFDRLLLRPRSLITQVAGSFFHIHRIVRVLTGLGIILWALNRLEIPFTLINTLILVFALIGGTFTYMGVFLMSSGIAFFTIRALDWIFIFTNASYQVTRIPADYMPRILKHVFTFFMPMLLISYYPAAILCGFSRATWQGFISIPAGLAFLLFANAIWRFGVRHYQSTGS